MEAGRVHHLPVGRELFVDERGVGLRATWHLEHGFVNVSIWRDDVCTETFHLSVADAARLVGFLAEGLGEATTSFLAERDAGSAAPGTVRPAGPRFPRLAHVRSCAAAAATRWRRRWRR